MSAAEVTFPMKMMKSGLRGNLQMVGIMLYWWLK